MRIIDRSRFGNKRASCLVIVVSVVLLGLLHCTTLTASIDFIEMDEVLRSVFQDWYGAPGWHQYQYYQMIENVAVVKNNTKDAVVELELINYYLENMSQSLGDTVGEDLFYIRESFEDFKDEDIKVSAGGIGATAFGVVSGSAYSDFEMSNVENIENLEDGINDRFGLYGSDGITAMVGSQYMQTEVSFLSEAMDMALAPFRNAYGAISGILTSIQDSGSGDLIFVVVPAGTFYSEPSVPEEDYCIDFGADHWQTVSTVLSKVSAGLWIILVVGVMIRQLRSFVES